MKIDVKFKGENKEYSINEARKRDGVYSAEYEFGSYTRILSISGTLYVVTDGSFEKLDNCYKNGDFVLAKAGPITITFGDDDVD